MLRWTRWYNSIQITNDTFLRYLILISLKQKILFKHFLTTQNLVTVLFNTQKSCLSIVYYWEIYETSWNSLKRDDTENYCSSIIKLWKHHLALFKLILSQILKISISTFKGYIFKIHSFCIELAILRSQIISYHFFSFMCHHSTILLNTGEE